MPSDSVIAVAGSSGLIGTALVYALRATDHRVLRIVRRAPSNADEVYWNPDTGEFDPDTLRGVDAVVNLCGVNVGAEAVVGRVQAEPARQPHRPDRGARPAPSSTPACPP